MPAATEAAARASAVRRVVVITSLPKVEKHCCRQKRQSQRWCQAPADSQTIRLSNKCSGRKGDGSVRHPLRSRYRSTNHTLITLCLHQLLAACGRLATDAPPRWPKEAASSARDGYLKVFL